MALTDSSAIAAAVDVLGYSCRFPESENGQQFWDNLLTGRDMVTENARRWPVGLHETPKRFGKLIEYHLFDAPFFSVHGKQAQRMDPQMRKMLEVSYEAWVDSGVDHKELRGSSKVGVYLGVCGSEVHALWLGDVRNITGYEQTGCTMSMMANRLSFFYGFKGPSKAVDTACSSAFVALNDAVIDLQRGRVDYAIVGGSSALFRPATSLAFLRLKMLSPDGACKSFDASANGYARAEGVACVILKRSDVQDVPWIVPHDPYCTIMAIGTNNDGYTPQGITFPSGESQYELGMQVCNAADIDPSDVVYVEAHGTGTVVGDAQELSAIDRLYGSGAGRTAQEPLLIGSVKSNMGHCEGASGLAGLIKVILSFENGLLPGNLHFNEPNPNNESLNNGIIKVVTAPTPWEGGLVGLSSFGFGGSNVHCLVAGKVRQRGQGTLSVQIGNPQMVGETIIEEVQEEIKINPELIIPIAARTQEGAQSLIDKIKLRAAEAATLAIPLKRYANANRQEAHKLCYRATICNGESKWENANVGAPPPIWFVFSGNGSQWPRMALPLLESSPTFKRSILQCAAALQPLGIDLMAEFKAEQGWQAPKLAMVGLVAVQIGLVDLLREEHGITPAGMLGHSAGEIACGYADGCLTLKQTILLAYHRGRMAPDHGVKGGLMAAVGLSAEAAETRLKHAGLTRSVVGCDNSATGVTLAGPEEELKPLLQTLKNENIFVKEVDTLGIAYHSPALEPFSGTLKKSLEALIPDPKPRSKTWLSTSYPLDSEDPQAGICGPEYHVMSYKSRVLFKGACEQIPKEAVLLEIGPHSIMRSALRQNCHGVPYVATMKKDDDAAVTVREAVAGLWRKGAALEWSVPQELEEVPELPPDIRSCLVSWNHSADYEIPTYKDYADHMGGGQWEKTYDLGGAHKFIVDHIVDGRILMPGTSYVVTAWEALAVKEGKSIAELPVTFDNITIHQAVPAEEGQKITLGVQLAPGNRFYVMHAGDLICDGIIKPVRQTATAKDAAEGSADAEGKTGSDAEPKEQQQGDKPQPGAAEANADFRIPAGGTATVTITSPSKLKKGSEISPASPGLGKEVRPEYAKAKEFFSQSAVSPTKTKAPAADAEGVTAEQKTGNGAESAAQEEAPVDDGSGAWEFSEADTINKETFYRTIGRTGIQYGPDFKMVWRVNTADTDAQMRWDNCWIRLLDGMLQLSVADTKDHQLRIPVQIRHISINNAEGTSAQWVACKMDRVMSTVTNELATVTGLELLLAPRRSQQEHTVTVKMAKFVPYGTNVDTDMQRLTYVKRLLRYCQDRMFPCLSSWEEKIGTTLPPHLQELKAMCEKFVHEPLWKSLPVATDAELFDNPEHCLARLARDLSQEDVVMKNIQNPMQAIVSHPEHEHMYQKDPACRSFNTTVLSTLLGVVLENMAPGFRVLEVGCGTGGLTKDAVPILDKDGSAELLQYCATDVTPAFGPTLLDAIRSQKLAFKVWDINNPPPEELGQPFDLLVGTNVLHTARNLAEMLKNVRAAIADGGFLCFYEMTCHLPTLLWGLDAQCWQFTDKRDFGLWVGIDTWETLLAETGFEPVMVHKDSIDSSAFFLYRKLPAKPLEPAVLLSGPPVEASDDQMSAWLEEYRTKLSDVAGVKLESKDAHQEQAGGIQPAAPPETSAEEAGKEKVERRLWLYGSVSSAPGTAAFFRTAKTEPLGDRVRLIFKADPVIGPAAGLPETPQEYLKEIAQVEKMDLTQNIFINGVWGHYRMFDVPLKEALTRSVEQSPYGAHMEIGTYGDLNSLYWAENEKPDHPDMILVGVTYGALNFKDVMLAYGKLDRDRMGNGYCGSRLGFEFSGTLPSPEGDRRVMGVARQAIATHVWGLPYLLWDVPASWSLKDAATVPVAYLTAYYALVMRGRMTKNSKVLIHSGTGAVGLAAIRIALYRGAEVFTTCGSKKKRDYLLSAFPQLKSEHIGDSRSCSFEEMVMRQTGGRGVDLALNALADDKLHATVRCIAPNGSLLEIGKFDIIKGTGLSMRPMHHNISFQGINLDSVFLGYSKEEVWEMHRHMNEGIANGEVQPLPWTVFSRSKPQDAFRYLAGGTHMGKVLIQCTDTEGPLMHSGPPPETDARTPAADVKELTPVIDPPIKVKAVFTAEPERSYLITGGLGGFGLALAVWLATKGARQIVISSRRGLRSGEQKKVISKLAEMGVKITLSTMDVAKLEEARELINIAENQAPLAIIFHLAMVLDDRLLLKQDGKSWNTCVRPKAVGAWNLDLASRGLAHLEDFVCFSSLVATSGHQGQANYAYANGAVDLLCEARRQSGMPAVSIEWGPIADVGFVAENLTPLLNKVNTRLFDLTMPQPIDECLKYLGEILCADRKSVRPVVSIYANKVASKTVDEDDGRGLVEQVMDLLGIKEGEIGENENLSGMGIDSMQVVEVRSRIQRALGRPFPLEEIGTLTLGKLRQMEKEAGLGPSTKKKADDDVPEEAADSSGQDVTEPLLPKREAPGNTASDASSPQTTSMAKDIMGGTIPALNAETAIDISKEQRDTVINVPPPARHGTAQQKGPARSLWPTLFWLLQSSIGIFYIALVLILAAWPVIHFLAKMASVYNKWIVLPLLPVGWMAFGILLMVQTCISKRLFSPIVASHRTFRVFSMDFFGWWLSQRLIGITNLLFAENLRGTPYLVWWFRSLGARIGKEVYIDSLDISDPEMINIGDDTVVNEGVTIAGHYFKDNCVHFGQVLIGKNVCLQPFSLVQPGSIIDDNAVLAALQKSKSALMGVKKDPFAFLKPRVGKTTANKSGGSETQDTGISGMRLNKCLASICQTLALYAQGLIVSLAAYFGYLVLAYILQGIGFWQSMVGFDAGYVVAALLSLLSPLYIVVLPIMAQGLMTSTSWPVFFARAATAYGIFGMLFAFVVAFTAYGIALCLGTIIFKWLVVGRVRQGVHWRYSLYGMRLWAAQRLIDQCVKRFVCHTSGSWGFSAWLRALGARVGRFSTFRFVNSLNVPDMLNIGDGVHCGDTASLVASFAVDAKHIRVGEIVLEPQVIIGFSTVVMPDSKLCRGLLLSALSATQPGQQLESGRLCMGAPACALTKHNFGEVITPVGAVEMLIYWMLPFAQSVWSLFILALALFGATYASAQLVDSQPYVAPLLLEPLILVGAALALLAMVACSKWITQGRIMPGTYRKFTFKYNRRSFTAAVQAIVGDLGITEVAKGSTFHNLYLWMAGAHIGRDVYFDNGGCMDFDLVTFGDGTIVSQGAHLLCHIGVYRNGQFMVEQGPSDFGHDSVIGTRAVTVTNYCLAPKACLPALELGLKASNELPV